MYQVLYRVGIIYVDWKLKMAIIAVQRFFLDNNEATFDKMLFFLRASYGNVIVNCLNHHFGMLIQTLARRKP